MADKTISALTSATTPLAGTEVLPIVQSGATVKVPVNSLQSFAPVFSARNSTNQSITSGIFTKVTLDTEDFDTNSNFASSTFTPTVAGYYEINCSIRFNGASITSAVLALYKNGSSFTRLFESNFTIGTDFTFSGSAIVSCNGTTDTIEMYGYIAGTSPTFNFANSTACCRMSGTYLRSL